MLFKSLPNGSLTNIAWKYPGLRCDPYFVWFDRTYLPPAAQNNARAELSLPVDVFVELAADPKLRYKSIKWLVESAGFTGRYPADPAKSDLPRFMTGRVPLGLVKLMVKEVACDCRAFDRFEMAGARFVPGASMLLTSKAVTDAQRLAAMQELSKVHALQQKHRDWRMAQEPADLADKAKRSKSRAPLVFVVDDFCTFGNHAMVKHLRTLWHQGRAEKRPGAQSGQADPSARSYNADLAWEFQSNPPVSERGPSPSPIQICPLADEASGKESYGAILNFKTSLNGRLRQATDELESYRLTDYMQPVPSWSHGSAVLHAIAHHRQGPPGSDPDHSRCLPHPEHIHFVQLPSRTVLDTSGGSLAGFAIDAIHRAVRTAALNCRPAVIVNLSYGTHSGPHDGSSMFERAMLDLLELYDGRDNGPVLHIVLPAGNTHLGRIHASGFLTTQDPGLTTTLHWKVPPDDDSDSFVELWFCDDHGDAHDVKVSLTTPDGRRLGSVGRGIAMEWAESVEDGRGKPDEVLRASVIFPESPAQGTRGSMALIALSPTMRRAAFGKGERYLDGDDETYLGKGFERVPMEAPAGVWKIELTNKSKHAVRFHAWVQRDDAAPGRRRSSRGYRGRQSYLLDGEGTAVNPRFTLNGIATATHPEGRLWVVGAMDETGRLSRYSAAGPDRGAGHRIEGPDVVITVDGSRNRPGRLVGGVLAGSRIRLSGTSIGAAVFTRMLHYALLIQCFPNRHNFWVPNLALPMKPFTVTGEPELAPDLMRGWYQRLRCVSSLCCPLPKGCLLPKT